MNTLLAVLTGGGLTAAAGLLGGWLNNRMGAKRDQAMRAHELVMASEARRQDRLERAYTELGMFLAHWGDWASSIYPFIGPVPTPDPMLPQERHRIGTLVANHGSPEVRALLTQWAEIAAKIENAGHVITMAEQSQNPGALDEQARRERLALEDYRKALHEAASRVFDQMKAELDGPTQLPQLPSGGK